MGQSTELPIDVEGFVLVGPNGTKLGTVWTHLELGWPTGSLRFDTFRFGTVVFLLNIP